MTSKKLETCEYIYLHLHNFYAFIMGCFVLCVPHPLFIFGFKHFISFNHFIFFLIAPVLCPNSLNLWPYLFVWFFFKQTQESLYNMLQERIETREIEKKNKNDGEQTINSNLQTTFTREIFQYRQVKMMCQNLFPYLHL